MAVQDPLDEIAKNIKGFLDASPLDSKNLFDYLQSNKDLLPPDKISDLFKQALLQASAGAVVSVLGNENLVQLLNSADWLEICEHHHNKKLRSGSSSFGLQLVAKIDSKEISFSALAKRGVDLALFFLHSQTFTDTDNVPLAEWVEITLYYEKQRPRKDIFKDPTVKDLPHVKALSDKLSEQVSGEVIKMIRAENKLKAEIKICLQRVQKGEDTTALNKFFSKENLDAAKNKSLLKEMFLEDRDVAKFVLGNLRLKKHLMEKGLLSPEEVNSILMNLKKQEKLVQLTKENVEIAKLVLAAPNWSELVSNAQLEEIVLHLFQHAKESQDFKDIIRDCADPSKIAGIIEGFLKKMKKELKEKYQNLKLQEKLMDLQKHLANKLQNIKMGDEKGPLPSLGALRQQISELENNYKRFKRLYSEIDDFVKGLPKPQAVELSVINEAERKNREEQERGKILEEIGQFLKERKPGEPDLYELLEVQGYRGEKAMPPLGKPYAQKYAKAKDAGLQKELGLAKRILGNPAYRELYDAEYNKRLALGKQFKPLKQ